ncbi:hypothetical protein LZ554_009089 [Drepanopeziza brunnea f. sp. 'monogermtubi']|nr:hypothetical protein LZ554_009089 [Drepanopeziza brunnea f. sp. 'monogermtubi']
MSSSIQASTSAAVNPADPPLGEGPNDYEMTGALQDGVEDEGSNDGTAEGGGAGQVDGTAEDGTAEDGTADDGTANDEAAQRLTQYTEWSAQDPLWFRVYRILFWPHIKIYFYLEPHLARLPEPVMAFGAFAIGLLSLFAWVFVAGTVMPFVEWLHRDREEEPSSSLSESASAFSFATATGTATATATATSSTTL